MEHHGELVGGRNESIGAVRADCSARLDLCHMRPRTGGVRLAVAPHQESGYLHSSQQSCFDDGLVDDNWYLLSSAQRRHPHLSGTRSVLASDLVSDLEVVVLEWVVPDS